MTKLDHRMIFALVACFLYSAAVGEPDILGDQNRFLSAFVNHEFLGFVGVMVSIALASSANIYLILRKKEEDVGCDFLLGTKRAVRRSAFSLVLTLALSLALVVVKGAVPEELLVIISVINASAIVLSLWVFLIILDITRLAFKI